MRLARENPSWGYRRTHGELAMPAINVAPSTVWEILRRNGIEPAPQRDRQTWAAFLHGQAHAILAADLSETRSLTGARLYVLAVIEPATRRVRDRDRDREYTAAFDAVFNDEGIAIVKTGIRVPRMNAIMERWVRPCKAELLDRTLIVNQAQPLHALREDETFYNQHRPHRALHAAAPLRPLPQPITGPDRLAHLDIRRRDRIGGILHEYRHAA